MGTNIEERRNRLFMRGTKICFVRQDWQRYWLRGARVRSRLISGIWQPAKIELFGIVPASGLDMRSCQHPGSGSAAQKTEQMPFPGDPTVQRQDAEQGGSPDEKDDQGQGQRSEPAFEPAGAQEVTEVGKDHATGANVDRLAAQEPGTETTNQSTHDGYNPEVGLSTQNNQAAKDQNAGGVSDKMEDAAMQERRPEDSRQTLFRAGPDAVCLQPPSKHHHVEDGDNPDGGDEPNNGPGCAPKVSKQAFLCGSNAHEQLLWDN